MMKLTKLLMFRKGKLKSQGVKRWGLKNLGLSMHFTSVSTQKRTNKCSCNQLITLLSTTQKLDLCLLWGFYNHLDEVIIFIGQQG